ncbi:MAG: endopeptidase La [Candidatus Aminicenantes bacterium]|nr:endopeptidase La [Candidatus Aminicenantes bacterium]
MDSLNTENIKVPLIPLRELVSFPSTIIPILVGREKSISALKISKKLYGNYIFLSVQTNQISDDPSQNEISKSGILAKIEKISEQKNGSYRVIIHGIQRGKIEKYIKEDDYFLVKINLLTDFISDLKKDREIESDLIKYFKEYMAINKFKFEGILDKLKSSKLPEITNIIPSILNISIQQKQLLLEEIDVTERGLKLLNILKKELLKIRSIVELKQLPGDDIPGSDADEYRKSFEKNIFPENVKKSALKEIQRFELMPPYSAEGTVSRSYLDWLLMIPWKKLKKESGDLKKASEILDEDHYGLEKVKERVLDYLAVKQLKEDPVGEILCFVGPPGVGKSSLSRSIARALSKPFVRVSLGGLKDEAEIRGHRRTYIGSYPGQIIKGLKKAKYMNPVFLLDEIDKLSSDFKGDPSSALLEVLDSDQNMEFVDHYLDLEIDLSKVFFITTANSIDNIPSPLLDRMEIIEIEGYTQMEKLQIARNYLIRNQSEKNGIKPADFSISDEILMEIINSYTRESGVRELERQIGNVTRKIARNFVENGKKDSEKELIIDKDLLEKFLGIPLYSDMKILKQSEVGVSIGMAWTPFGGDLLIVESKYLKGNGELILTGRLGEVMKESSSTAYSYVKLKLYDLDFDTDLLENYNIHLHIPQGAVPKEGPSAGVTLAVAMISLLTGIKVKANYAITGEITLRGEILPVGGIREKIIAAHRYGVKNVIIPLENRKDYIEDIPEEVKKSVDVHFVENMDNVLEVVLEKTIKLNNIKSRIIKPYMNPNIQ